MNHPLLNPESKHYQMIDGVEAIERLEQMYSKEELAVWAKITAMKYRLRICNKDDINKEAVKINGYEAYFTYLTDKPKTEPFPFFDHGYHDDIMDSIMKNMKHGSVVPVDAFRDAFTYGTAIHETSMSKSGEILHRIIDAMSVLKPEHFEKSPTATELEAEQGNAWDDMIDDGHAKGDKFIKRHLYCTQCHLDITRILHPESAYQCGRCEKRMVDVTDERSLGDIGGYSISDEPEPVKRSEETPVEEAMYEAKNTPGQSNEEACEEAEEASHSDTVGGTEEREDDKFLDVIEALQKYIGGDAKVSLIGHFKGHPAFAIEECDPNELPPGEELATIVRELRPNHSGRSTPLGGWLPENVEAVERLEGHLKNIRDGLLFGNLDARNIRELVSDAVAVFMVTVERIQQSQD